MVDAQVDADPDVLPRTDNFGLNYMAFVDLCDDDTVPDFLKLAYNCCIVSTHTLPFRKTHCANLFKVNLENIGRGMLWQTLFQRLQTFVFKTVTI
jgi:hypothetical protein